LLSVGQEFDFLPLAAVDGDQVDDDLFERFFGAERDCAPRRLAHTRQEIAAFLVVLAHMVNQSTDRTLTENVEIDMKRHKQPVLSASGQIFVHRSICSAVMFVQLLPPLQPFRFVVLAVDRRFLAVDRNRTKPALRS
jgi:hypothetical protein